LVSLRVAFPADLRVLSKLQEDVFAPIGRGLEEKPLDVVWKFGHNLLEKELLFGDVVIRLSFDATYG